MGKVATQTFLNTDRANSLQFQVHIGSKQSPEYSISSLEETCYQLRKMLQQEVGGTMDINHDNYTDYSLIVGVETETKGKPQAFTSIFTQAGAAIKQVYRFRGRNNSYGVLYITPQGEFYRLWIQGLVN